MHDCDFPYKNKHGGHLAPDFYKEICVIITSVTFITFSKNSWDQYSVTCGEIGNY